MTVKAIKRAEKRNSIPQLKKKLDRVFSEYIRRRDTFGDFHREICVCITCGKMGYWKKMDNGHYIKRQYMATRYDEQNCNAQCKKCNWLEQGANEIYRVKIDEKWGTGTADELERKKHNTVKWTAWEYEMLIKLYQDKIKEEI